MARYSNPFIQYQNGTGSNSLPGATLDFFEPGTTTRKDTFSDSGLTTANTNPVVADGSGVMPDIFLNGTYKVVLKDAAGIVQPEGTKDPVGETAAGQFDAFLNDVTYNIPDIVKGSDNEFYKSLTNSNQGNDPTTSPTNWEQVAVEPLPRGQIDGLITSNGTDTDHDIDTSVGVCVDSTNDILMQLKTIITKQIDANWVPGTNMGGFPSGLTLTADTWYHYFLIAKADGTVDSGWDTSLIATNLLADATGFTLFRRIASHLTDGSSNILAFSQRGDEFLWDVVVFDVSTNNPGTSAITQVLTTPLGIKTIAISTYRLVDSSPVSSTSMLITSLDVADTVPSGANESISTTINAERNNVWPQVRTNISSQIRYRLDQSTAGHNVGINTQGWIDSRGKE